MHNTIQELAGNIADKAGVGFWVSTKIEGDGEQGYKVRISWAKGFEYYYCNVFNWKAATELAASVIRALSAEGLLVRAL